MLLFRWPKRHRRLFRRPIIVSLLLRYEKRAIMLVQKKELTRNWELRKGEKISMNITDGRRRISWCSSELLTDLHLFFDRLLYEFFVKDVKHALQFLVRNDIIFVYVSRSQPCSQSRGRTYKWENKQ